MASAEQPQYALWQTNSAVSTHDSWYAASDDEGEDNFDDLTAAMADLALRSGMVAAARRCGVLDGAEVRRHTQRAVHITVIFLGRRKYRV